MKSVNELLADLAQTLFDLSKSSSIAYEDKDSVIRAQTLVGNIRFQLKKNK